ncbi:uncharacterized protein KY384_002758 [Bacidia gigantensis]|uniref:uncharacterized protein n=1 Tax=Bacidia gigantensis TaxID=2732470 RepID=UPI001D0518FB|nr:uncharacterized protein KY384_002758 [Bacidia gigantensis]KAG8532880.1 hypothetical protein KY384_002758 [Bacidia gigantensis]
MSVQDLARSLTAAGWARLPDQEEEKFYLVHVRDGNMIEKLWVGDNAKNEVVIASDARDSTTASYLIYAGQDLCYAYNEDIEEWEQTGLGRKWNIVTSPHSKLSASFGPNGTIVVSYQDPAGRLAGVMSAAEDKWEAFSPPEADPLAGTPLCLENIDDKMHLFYVGKNSNLRYLLFDPAIGKWQDNVLQTAKFDTPIDNFSVVKNPEKDSFQSYFLTGGSMWNVDGDKGKTHLGKVESNGKLIPSDKAQAGWRKSPAAGSAFGIELEAEDMGIPYFENKVYFASCGRPR